MWKWNTSRYIFLYNISKLGVKSKIVKMRESIKQGSKTLLNSIKTTSGNPEKTYVKSCSSQYLKIFYVKCKHIYLHIVWYYIFIILFLHSKSDGFTYGSRFFTIVNTIYIYVYILLTCNIVFASKSWTLKLEKNFMKTREEMRLTKVLIKKLLIWGNSIFPLHLRTGLCKD